MGDDLQDLDRLDRTEIPKELRRVRSTPARRRVYSAEEKYIVKVGLDGQFSDVKRIELEFPGAETRDELHELDRWPFFPRPSALIHLLRPKDPTAIAAGA